MRTHTLLNRPVRWRSRGSFWLGWRSRRISVLMPAAQARQSAAQPPRPAVISTSPTEDEVRVISRAAPPPPILHHNLISWLKWSASNTLFLFFRVSRTGSLSLLWGWVQGGCHFLQFLFSWQWLIKGPRAALSPSLIQSIWHCGIQMSFCIVSPATWEGGTSERLPLLKLFPAKLLTYSKFSPIRS